VDDTAVGQAGAAAAGWVVEPAELVERSERLGAVAADVRAAAGTLGGFEAGTPLLGGLDGALARFATGVSARGLLLAGDLQDAADRLRRASSTYVAVDAAVRRAAGG
jgi:hypothetical protein